MEGERELTTGMLAKDTSFRLIVSGNIGVKEIERLIKKLVTCRMEPSFVRRRAGYLSSFLPAL
jgi:hypothetical protein